MLGRRERRQPELCVAGSLRGLVPDDHILARVDRVLGLGWLRSEVEPLSRAAAGGAARHRPRGRGAADARGTAARERARPAADARGPGELGDPLVHRLRPARGAAGPLQPDAHPPAPGRGAERFRAVLARTAQSCVAAGIATGEVVHIDATLVRADVSWDAIARRHAGAVAAANGEEGQGQAVSGEAPPDGDPPAEPGPGRAAVCTTDPDAPLVKDRQARRGEPADKQHTAVDGRAGVVLDVAVTTGRGRRPRRPRSRRGSTPSRPSRAARSGSRRWTRPTPSPGCSPRWRGARSRRWRRPRPRGRRAASSRSAGSSWTPGTGSYAARANAPCARTASPTTRDSKPTAPRRPTDCRPCPLRAACIGSKVPRRAILLLHKDHPALPRARREHARWGERERSIYARHRIRAEGFHGEAKTWHGLARAVRRG
jgi:hypothetical protein